VWNKKERLDLVSVSADLEEVVRTYDVWAEETSRITQHKRLSRKVFVDLDGVLCDFDRGVGALFAGRKVRVHVYAYVGMHVCMHMCMTGVFILACLSLYMLYFLCLLSLISCQSVTNLPMNVL